MLKILKALSPLRLIGVLYKTLIPLLTLVMMFPKEMRDSILTHTVIPWYPGVIDHVNAILGFTTTHQPLVLFTGIIIILVMTTTSIYYAYQGENINRAVESPQGATIILGVLILTCTQINLLIILLIAVVSFVLPLGIGRWKFYLDNELFAPMAITLMAIVYIPWKLFRLATDGLQEKSS